MAKKVLAAVLALVMCMGISVMTAWANTTATHKGLNTTYMEDIVFTITNVEQQGRNNPTLILNEHGIPVDERIADWSNYSVEYPSLIRELDYFIATSPVTIEHISGRIDALGDGIKFTLRNLSDSTYLGGYYDYEEWDQNVPWWDEVIEHTVDFNVQDSKMTIQTPGFYSIDYQNGAKGETFIVIVKGEESGTPSQSTTAPNLTAASQWAHDGINSAFALGLIPQSLQSNYTQATTRAEFCALAVALYENVKSEITGRTTFADTDDVNVQKMASLGVVSGVGNNRFDPNAPLTREQSAVMLSRLAEAIGKPFAKNTPTFSDNSSISSWAVDGVGAVQGAEIISGTGNNNFSPKQPYTREQSIITILRVFETMK